MQLSCRAHVRAAPSPAAALAPRRTQQRRRIAREAARAQQGKVYIDPVEKEAAAFAPATVANLGPGFDWMGCAVEVRPSDGCAGGVWEQVGAEPRVQGSRQHPAMPPAAAAPCAGIGCATTAALNSCACLALLQGEGDIVTARVLPDRPGEVVIESIEGDGGRLSLEAPKNCVGASAVASGCCWVLAGTAASLGPVPAWSRVCGVRQPAIPACCLLPAPCAPTQLLQRRSLPLHPAQRPHPSLPCHVPLSLTCRHCCDRDAQAAGRCAHLRREPAPAEGPAAGQRHGQLCRLCCRRCLGRQQPVWLPSAQRPPHLCGAG